MNKRYKDSGVQTNPATSPFLFLGVTIRRVNVPALEISIVKVVATATLGRSVDLASFPQLFPRFISYDPERYFAAYFKSNRMQGNVSIFSSGKIVCVGLRNQKDIAIAIHRLPEILS